MSDYKQYGKATIYSNEDANSENKRPNLSGSIEVKEEIPAGTMLRIAGWVNFKGTVEDAEKAQAELNKAQWSIGMNLSSKVGGEDNTYKKQTSGQSYEVKKDEDIPF